MITVLKGLTLYGSRYEHGSPLPLTVWSRCDKRLRTVLERGRFLTIQPATAADSPAVTSLTPRTAGGPTLKRGRPRKAG